MNEEKIKAGLKAGKGPRWLARELGISRQEVEVVARRQIFVRKKTRYARMVWSVVMLAILLAFMMLAHREFREPTDLEMHTNVLRCAEALPVVSGVAPWIMEEEPQPFTIVGGIIQSMYVDAVISLLERQTDRLNLALDRNVDIPEVAGLKRMFGRRMIPTLFSSKSGGVTMTLSKDKDQADATKIFREQGWMEVVFYPHSVFRHSKIQERLIFYDGAWKAFFMGALNFQDEVWFDAIVAHELWHAKRAREGAASSIAPMLSDEWIREELEAHRVESKVLNRHRGGYQSTLESLAKGVQTHSLRQFYSRIKPADIGRLDKFFRPGLPEERDLRAAQYLLDSALAWCQLNYEGKELEAKRIEAYRLIISPQSTGAR